MKDAPIVATTPFAKKMLEDPKTKNEIQIIYNAKANPFNPAAWQKVYDTFAPLVRNAIRDSGIQRLNLTNAQYETEANNELRKAVKDYDINNPQGAQPKTFFSQRLFGNLSKVKRSGKMVSGTEKKESEKVMVNKVQNILKSQNKPSDAKSIMEYLSKRGYKYSLSDIQSALAFNVRELSGSQLIGGDDISGNGAITYQELLESKNSKTPGEMMDEHNKMMHVYNSIFSFKDREFIKAVLWIEGDKLGLGQPTALLGVKKPSNFKELCGIYKIGYAKGKKIYVDFVKAAGDL